MNGADAVCQVAPEWWGAFGPEFTRPKLAVEGCNVCPLKGRECLSLMASGGWVGPDDVDGLVASGLYGQPLVDAINELAERKVPLRPCGTDAAYRRHLKRGERACGACREAHARDRARRKDAA